MPKKATKGKSGKKPKGGKTKKSKPRKVPKPRDVKVGRFKIKTQSRVASGRPRTIPKRVPKKSGDSVIAVVKRKSGPNKGKSWLLRFWEGADGKTHSAPAIDLPRSQMRPPKRMIVRVRRKS